MIKAIPKDVSGLNKVSYTTGKTFVFVRRELRKHCFVFDNGKMIKIYTSLENEISEGSIVVGRISELKPAIHCGFVNISATEKCFIKESDLKGEYNLSRPGKDLKSGDLLAVKVLRLASKGKKASVTTIISEDEETKRELLSKAAHLTQYSTIFETVPRYLSVLDELSGDEKLVSDDPLLIEEIKNYMSDLSVELYSDKLVSLKALLGIETKLSDALNKKVWLKSGAFIVIEPTEAMTVIDVNSGKNTSKNKEDLYFDINIEAGYAIIDQIILRNLSGIIMVDFINMSDKAKRTDLINILKEYAVKNDININIVDITPLGIMEITRRKSGNTIYEQFYV